MSFLHCCTSFAVVVCCTCTIQYLHLANLMQSNEATHFSHFIWIFTFLQQMCVCVCDKTVWRWTCPSGWDDRRAIPVRESKRQAAQMSSGGHKAKAKGGVAMEWKMTGGREARKGRGNVQGWEEVRGWRVRNEEWQKRRRRGAMVKL